MIDLSSHPTVSSLPFLLASEGGPLPVPAHLRSKSHEDKNRTKLIFVIDDEPNITDSLVEILNDRGYEAHAFYDGHAAIDSARRECPDIIISDIVMPKLNGIDTAMVLRQVCPEAHIILFSGQAGVTDMLKEARAKGHEFDLLPKPVHPAQLLKTLSRLK